MKYVLIENSLTIAAKKPMYVSSDEMGNFIYITNKIEEARTFDSIEELDIYAKKKKLKKKDFAVVEVE